MKRFALIFWLQAILPVVAWQADAISTNSPLLRYPLRTIAPEHPLDLRFPANAEPPLIRLGSLPSGQSVPFGPKNSLVDDVVSGALKLWHPRAQAPLVVVFVSPEHNSGEEWYVSSISRAGNKLTVVIDGFTDGLERGRNFVSREARLVALPELEAGFYELHVTQRNFFKGASFEQRYPLRDVKAGHIDFAVVANADIASGRLVNGTLKLAALSGGELKSMGEIPEEMKNWKWQPLAITSSSLVPAQGAAPNKENILQVGTFDFQNWLNVKSKTIQSEAPKLSALATRQDRVFAMILSPVLFNTGEALSVKEIHWNGPEVTIRVDVWRDHGARTRNIRTQPLLIVPLELPLSGKPGEKLHESGNYSVAVEFNPLLAPNTSSAYEVDLPARSQWKAVRTGFRVP